MAANTMMMMNMRTMISSRISRIKSPRDVTPRRPPAFSTCQRINNTANNINGYPEHTTLITAVIVRANNAISKSEWVSQRERERERANEGKR